MIILAVTDKHLSDSPKYPESSKTTPVCDALSDQIMTIMTVLLTNSLYIK